MKHGDKRHHFQHLVVCFSVFVNLYDAENLIPLILTNRKNLRVSLMHVLSRCFYMLDEGNFTQVNKQNTVWACSVCSRNKCDVIQVVYMNIGNLKHKLSML
jgi:hypothetical protein